MIYPDYTVHANTHPGIPGTTGPSVCTYPLQWKNTHPLIASAPAQGSPVNISTSVIIGVDTPFLAGWGIPAEPTPQREWAKRRGHEFGVAVWSDFLGTPLVLTLPTPIALTNTFAPSLEYPQAAWAVARKRAIFRAGAATWDNPPVFPSLPPASTYSDNICRLLSEIQRHLLETPDGGVTWSSLFSAAEVLRLVNERIVRFLLETGILRKRSQITVTSGTTTVDMPSDLVEIRRVAWEGASVGSLSRVDPFGMDAGLPGWESGSSVPFAYIEEPLPALRVRLVQTPSANGLLDVVYVYAPSALTGTCSLAIPLPAMFVPYVKYGVLSDLLSTEGERHDPQRAEYAEARFAEGVELARLLLGTKN